MPRLPSMRSRSESAQGAADNRDCSDGLWCASPAKVIESAATLTLAAFRGPSRWKAVVALLVVRGTRTPVTVILDALAGGDSFETIMADYRLTIEDIRACIGFACDEVDRQTYHSLTA